MTLYDVIIIHHDCQIAASFYPPCWISPIKLQESAEIQQKVIKTNKGKTAMGEKYKSYRLLFFTLKRDFPFSE